MKQKSDVLKKITFQQKIQNRLPSDLVLEDETSFSEFTDDEYIVALSWIKSFKEHYAEYGKTETPANTFPMVSKRLRLDFGLYTHPAETEKNKDKHVIYLSENRQLTKTGKPKTPSVSHLEAKWQL